MNQISIPNGRCYCENQNSEKHTNETNHYVDYNKNKVSVDLMDQMIGIPDGSVSQKKPEMKVFFHLLLMAIVNNFIL